MNILFCQYLRADSLGNYSVHIYEVVTNLSKLGHNIVILNADRPSKGAQIDVSRQSLWQQAKSRLFSSRILQPVRGYILILWRLLCEIHFFVLGFITIVKHKGKFDVVYRRSNLFNSEYLLAKLFKIPSVKEVNGIMTDEIKISKNADRVSLWVIDRIERFYMPKADRIITVTSRLKELLHKNYGVPRDKIVVIPNGANTDLFKPMDTTKARDKLSLEQSNNYVCYVGAFYAWQGIESIIRSAPSVLQECPDTRYLIVGDGQLKQDLISAAEQIGVSDKVIFTGMVPYQKVPLYINASCVCVLPAANNFRNDKIGASSLKLYEYLACGRPVVVGDVAGVSDDVTDSGSGLVVNPRSVDEMAIAIITLLQNEQLRREMGKRARKIAVERHNWRKIAEQVAEVCQSLVKQ